MAIPLEEGLGRIESREEGSKEERCFMTND